MRSDLYENTAAPQNLKTQTVFYKIYNVAFIVCCVIIFILLNVCLIVEIKAIPSLLIIAGFFLISAIICSFIKRRLLMFFDYSYISGEVRIIKVINGKSRKRFLIFQCRDIYKIGNVGSEDFEKIYCASNVKKKIATPNGFNANNKLYYIAAKVGSDNYLIVLECDETFISYVINASGRTVVEKNFKKCSIDYNE